MCARNLIQVWNLAHYELEFDTPALKIENYPSNSRPVSPCCLKSMRANDEVKSIVKEAAFVLAEWGVEK